MSQNSDEIDLTHVCRDENKLVMQQLFTSALVFIYYKPTMTTYVTPIATCLTYILHILDC